MSPRPIASAKWTCRRCAASPSRWSEGEFLSVVGPSGSGKSTLFYILGGLAQADSGRVLVDGTDFARTTDSERTHLRRRKIGFVFQKFNLLPTLTARDNIQIALDIAGDAPTTMPNTSAISPNCSASTSAWITVPAS